ncbi:4Fe-4S ferredoxin [Desulfuribacillus stibiiarsenatis]|uniref:4Fe-4S ferredoxin n=1 Tax=Desulfuribacillus stibiiarsenatis TaxID=1390249 RepID=A0A1E5L914_9FIRM|nr:4Fe-4S dicluster domain-containing protein [Desulfuribacillus stibiiarsenatis]OEH86621.1 4Fe-4S ferredoxin [Desulfuribacillus stibiiarsenatis]
MPNYAMVIDLQNCVGCGACDIACKNENNVPSDFYWSNHMVSTTGTFPNVKFQYLPTLCNHCMDAPCVKACPTKAMYKDDNGLTLHSIERCIGCKTCVLADPYGVINVNYKVPHQSWQSDEALIPNVTAAPKEVIDKTNTPIPYYNPDREETYGGVRPRGVVEKCNFCDHRIKKGEYPYCCVACPARARIFGDLDDPDSEINHLLSRYTHKQLLIEKGTKPKIFYIRDF